jgi:hypothetical protein
VDPELSYLSVAHLIDEYYLSPHSDRKSIGLFLIEDLSVYREVELGPTTINRIASNKAGGNL